VPDDFEQCASLLLQKRRFDEAAGILQQGMKLIPHDVELHRLLALCYLGQNKGAEAQSVLQEATKTFPENSSIRTLLAEAQAGKTKN
jgi:predicted Zn-dependent protease